MYKELENTIPGFTALIMVILKAGRVRAFCYSILVDGSRRSGAFPRQPRLGDLPDKVISLINQHREGVVFLLWAHMRKRKGRLLISNAITY